MITREEALNFLNEKIANKNIIKHMLAAEAVMGELAQKFEPEKEELWKMAGLLHDGDYCENVAAAKQGIQVVAWLKEKGFEIPEEVSQAMAAHNHETGIEPQTKMDWALFCGDSLTGLIVATTLVLPSRKLADVTVERVLNRFKEKSFARGTRREDIQKCEEKLGLSLTEFVKISLGAMQKIAADLGL